MLELKSSCAEHDERASLNGLYSRFQKFIPESRIIGAWIEDDAGRPQAEQVVLPVLLISWAYIQSNRVHMLRHRTICMDGNTIGQSGPQPNRDYAETCGIQSLYRHIAVPIRIGRGTKNHHGARFRGIHTRKYRHGLPCECVLLGDFTEMLSMLRVLGIVIGLSGALASCTINKNLMFKTDREFAFNQLNVDSSNTEYRIAPNDFITVSVFTNDGNLLMENTTTSAERSRVITIPDYYYQVDVKGEVDLPIVGVQNLSGMTIIEAQRYLQDIYSVQYNKPYIVLRVINRRIMVFPGSGGEARVIPLVNSNVSLIEAIALAGGVDLRGNASRVKLIRTVGEKQEVYLIDLSTIEGIQYAHFPVQAGDIVYVEPTPDIGQEILRDLQPIFQILASTILIYVVFTQQR